MANNGGGFGMSTYSGSRSNSHASVWGEGMQAAPSIIGAGYNGSASEASAYDGGVASNGTATKDAMVPYQLNTNSLFTNNNSDRTLPTPGGKHYSSTMAGTSTLDTLPLSALSHRSSIGWSTDSTSSASHLSSQTSVTGSSTGHEYSGERSNSHRPSDSQEMAFTGLGYGYSSQATLRNSTLPGAAEDVGSSNGAYRLSKNALQSSDSGDASTVQELPSHDQRCRTVSQDSTPNHLSSMSIHHSTHSHNRGNLTSSAPSNNNIGDVPDSGTSSAQPQAAPAAGSAATAVMPASSALYGYTAALSITPHGGGGAQPQTRGHGIATSSGDGRLSNGYTYTRASGLKEYVSGGAGPSRSGGVGAVVADEYDQVSDVAAATAPGGRASVASISSLAGY